MLGEYTQRIYRELAGMTAPMAQSSLAQLCGCSLSFVNKEIKDLTKRRLVGRPSRTRFSMVNRTGLLLLWIGRRDSHSNDMKRISTDLDLNAQLSRISSLKRYAFTMEAAAFLMGIKENMMISEVVVYLPPDLVGQLNIKEGRGGMDLSIVSSSDDHLYTKSKAIDGNMVAPEAQVFVDLADWGTWSAHNLAVRLALTRDGYPVLATRQELEAFQ